LLNAGDLIALLLQSPHGFKKISDISVCRNNLTLDSEPQILQDFFPHIRNNKGHLIPPVNSNVPVLKMLKFSKQDRTTFKLTYQFS